MKMDSFSRRRQPNNLPVKLVEPSVGRIVELQLTEKNNYTAKLYIEQLITYAEGLEKFGVQQKVTDKTIQLTFPNGNMADKVRQTWKR